MPKPYVLIDRAGGWREMVAERLPVIVPVQRPVSAIWSDADAEFALPDFEVVRFDDGGLVDERGVTVLTPDGVETVPLGKYPRAVYRRARHIIADVMVSDLERSALNAKLDDMVKELAFRQIRGLVESPARAVPVHVRELNRDEATRATTFRVISEEQTLVSAAA